MLTTKIRQLNATRAKLARLERSIASSLRDELASLPAAYGFDSAKAFIRAVKAAAGHGGRRGSSQPRAGGRRRRRAVITDETRASVKKLVEAGKTGAAIAKQLKISLPSVQNIKKVLGITKPRK